VAAATGRAARPGTVSAHARLGATQVHDQITEMTPDSPSYHEARAEEQLALAERATTPGAVRAHVALADMHLEILYSDQQEADAKP
jgi:hypothetical protein